MSECLTENSLPLERGEIPDQKVSLVANVWVKQMHFKKEGDENRGHAHTFDHQTLIANGSFEIHIEDKVAVFKAPMIAFIAAGKEHKIVALEDNSVAYCIHAVRNGVNPEDIMNPDDIPEDKWFRDDAIQPLLMGKASGNWYRTTPETID
jgi:quercetin dioxygenase-like cupin family protein